MTEREPLTPYAKARVSAAFFIGFTFGCILLGAVVVAATVAGVHFFEKTPTKESAGCAGEECDA